MFRGQISYFGRSGPASVQECWISNQGVSARKSLELLTNENSAKTQTISKLPWVQTSAELYLNHSPDNLQFRRVIRAGTPAANPPRSLLMRKELHTPSQYQMANYRQQHQQSESPFTDLMKLALQVKDILNKTNELEKANLPAPTERLPKPLRAPMPVEPVELPIDINQVTTETFVEKLTSERDVLLKVHEAIRTLPESEIERLVGVALPQLQMLITHKLAGSVVQKLVARSQRMVDAVSFLDDYCIICFFHNEQASKVLQSVVQRSSTFRTRLLILVKDNWSDAISTVPGVFLICACITTCENPSELHWIYMNLIHNSSRIITSKYQKRILLTFLDLCTQAQQAEVCVKILAPVGLVRILRDKYLTSMIITLVNNGCATACIMLAAAFKKSFEELQNATFFRFMASRLNLAKSHSSLLNMLVHIVNCVMDEQDGPNCLQEAENFVHLAAIVATAGDRITKKDARRIGQHLIAIMDMLIHVVSRPL